jgi:hypothetical protein
MTTRTTPRGVRPEAAGKPAGAIPSPEGLFMVLREKFRDARHRRFLAFVEHHGEDVRSWPQEVFNQIAGDPHLSRAQRLTRAVYSVGLTSTPRLAEDLVLCNWPPETYPELYDDRLASEVKTL